VAGEPVEVPDTTTLLDAEPEARPNGAGRPASLVNVPVIAKPATPASTIYSSAAALNQAVDGKQLPKPRGDGDRPLERHN
jgi:hypothetical protein